MNASGPTGQVADALASSETGNPDRGDNKGGGRFSPPEIILRFNGFELFLCWHFLTLFSGGLWHGAAIGSDPGLEMRMLLFCVVGLGFAALGAFERRIPAPKGPRALIASSGALGCAATFASFCLAGTPQAHSPWYALLVVILGLSESALSFYWLYFSAFANGRRTCRRIALQMAIGALLSFVVLNLNDMLAIIVAAALPPLSGALLIGNMGEFPFRSEETIRRFPEETQPGSARRVVIVGALCSLLLGAACGIAIGGFYPNKAILLLSPDPAIIMGPFLAGIFIFLTYDNMPNRTGTIFMLSIGIATFAIGVLLVSPIEETGFARAKELLLMFGFTLLDFGLLTFTFHIASICGLRLDTAISGNRAASCLGIASGVAVGAGLFWLFGESGDYRFSIAVSACIIAIGIFVLTFSNTTIWTSGVESDINDEAPSADETEEPAELKKKRWIDCCREVASEGALSPREEEIFLLLAKGRNAEFIGNELYISRHTVKTHISNIYRKLEVHSAQEIITMVENRRESPETTSVHHKDESQAMRHVPQLSSPQ